MTDAMRVVALGVHVLDTLVRPVEEIPEGQGATLVEQITMTAAGTAGGTALTLVKLGATVQSAGAIGQDPLGDLLLHLLARDGIDTSFLVRRGDVQTSASVLPIRPDGSRPAFHVIGANGAYSLDDVPWHAIAAATHLHFGGPEFMGGEAAAQVLSFAREHGVTTSADCLAPGDPGIFALIADALPHVDYFLPNDEQAKGWTGKSQLADACQAMLDLGAGCVAATAGADGAVVATRYGISRVPAFAIDVVDTTGCGDAFSAGFLCGIHLGEGPVDAAAFGCGAAALVAGGLGSDYGDFDLERLQQFVRDTPTN
jgi:sugar/nucleoside kinase (ribokinase family)